MKTDPYKKYDYKIWKKRTKWPLQGDGRKKTSLEFEVSNIISSNPPSIWF